MTCQTDIGNTRYLAYLPTWRTPRWHTKWVGRNYVQAKQWFTPTPGACKTEFDIDFHHPDWSPAAFVYSSGPQSVWPTVIASNSELTRVTHHSRGDQCSWHQWTWNPEKSQLLCQVERQIGSQTDCQAKCQVKREIICKNVCRDYAR